MLSKQLRTLKGVSGHVQMAQVQHRNYFSVKDKVQARLSQPLKHFKSFFEPDGMNYESQLPDGYRLHGNTAATLSASITHNALEMN